MKEKQNSRQIPRCPKCNMELHPENGIDIDYPYFCESCDENFYTIEVVFTEV